MNKGEASYTGKSLSGEYTGLVTDPEELELDAQELKTSDIQQDVEIDGDDIDLHSPTSETRTERWANDIHRQRRSRQSEWRNSVASDGTLFHSPLERQASHHSDETLHELPPHVPQAKLPLLHRIGRGIFATTERVLVFLGYMQILTGIVTYTGICRDSYVNGCLAHLISMLSLCVFG